jgi:hypothetical protein
VISFRSIAVSTLLTIGAFGSVLYTSCNKDKCGTVTCENGGVCTSNLCVCATGYSDASCTTAWSTEYPGVYDCTVACSPQYSQAPWKTTISIDATDGGYTIDLGNFFNTNQTVIAYVDSVNHITIEPVAGTFGVSGSGTYKDTLNGEISLHFTTSSGSGASGYECNMVMIKE